VELGFAQWTLIRHVSPAQYAGATELVLAVIETSRLTYRIRQANGAFYNRLTERSLSALLPQFERLLSFDGHELPHLSLLAIFFTDQCCCFACYLLVPLLLTDMLSLCLCFVSLLLLLLCLRVLLSPCLCLLLPLCSLLFPEQCHLTLLESRCSILLDSLFLLEPLCRERRAVELCNCLRGPLLRRIEFLVNHLALLLLLHSCSAWQQLRADWGQARPIRQGRRLLAQGPHEIVVLMVDQGCSHNVAACIPGSKGQRS
jgi:hypothetical protein